MERCGITQDFILKTLRGKDVFRSLNRPASLPPARLGEETPGEKKNHKRYQEYENISDFDLNINTSFYRMHDPQTGRFLHIDPKPNESESPFVSMGNNPVINFDQLGDRWATNNDESIAKSLKSDLNDKKEKYEKEYSDKAKMRDSNKGVDGTELSSKALKVLERELAILDSRLSEIKNSISDIENVGSDQESEYSFRNGSSFDENGTSKFSGDISYDPQSKQYLIDFGGNSSLAIHEIRHAGYVAKGLARFKLDKNGEFDGIEISKTGMTREQWEVSAYRAQYGYEPLSLPKTKGGYQPKYWMDIDEEYIKEIESDSGKKPYKENK